MTRATTLRLDRLSLRNFRCFAECSIDLHPSLTVLVAENGKGKTAVLDAIGIALGLFVETLGVGCRTHGFERSDIRFVRAAGGSMLPNLQVEITASGAADGERLSWSRAVNFLGKNRVRTANRDAKSLGMAAGRLRDRLTTFAAGQREQPPPLPLVAFYGTGRLWSEHRLTQGKRSADPSALGCLAGYLDSLSSSSSFNAFADWYERTAKAVRSATAVAYGPNERPEKLLAAVREATRTVLKPTRWRDIDWEFPPNDEHGQPKGKRYLVVEHPDHGQRAIRASLEQMQGRRCAYCEGPLDSLGQHIEHFRRKRHFVHLTFDWANLYWSCDQSDSCGHYKDHGAGAYNSADLIDPCVDDPSHFFQFRSDGTIQIRPGLSQRDVFRARETLRVFNLHPDFRRLRNMRKAAASTYLSLVDELAALDATERSAYAQLEIQAAAGEPFRTLIRHMFEDVV